MLALIVTLICGLGLAACTPTFNWREVHVDEEGYRVMLPAKPIRMQRRISLDGLDVEMTMQAVDVESTSFAVGSIRLPMGMPGAATAPDTSDGQALSAGLRDRLLAGMRAQLVRNLRGQEIASQRIALAVVRRSGEVSSRVSGWQIEALGTARATQTGETPPPVQMLARFVGRGDRVWQAVVVGPVIDREQAATFLESLRLID